MPSGKLMPLDPEPDIRGTIIVSENGAGEDVRFAEPLSREELKGTPRCQLFRSHFASCRGAAAHRKPTPKVAEMADLKEGAD